ncbi:amidohydrolase family protein [Occultella aeris]|uniref:S-triazine hydrolase n=1 Tax=Occultella aeris TaxID=2761496 RepID=A0A7M4DK31_9MICO|nr:amidohydrolase family protein [Occultella aeris]VZO37421.1 S-triazine hydrolase [Occultella aeris]
MTPSLLLTDALLLPMADPRPGEPDWFRGWLAVGHDGRICGIGPGEAPTALLAPGVQVRALGGAIVAPGFISAHSHLFTSGLRGIAPESTLYPWVGAMMDVFAHTDAEDMYWSTLHGSLDFIANGITSAYNFTQSRVTWRYDPTTARNVLAAVHPPENLTRQFDGAADAGLRTIASIRLDDEAGPEAEVLATFADMVAAARTHSPPELFLGASVMGAVQWAAGPRTAEVEARAMRTHGITNQAHFVETAQGLDVQQAKFDWYVRAGALGPDLLFGHFIHPTDEMVDAVAAAGGRMVWQPTSNGRLASGVADVVRYARAGIGVGMGLDDQACTDISDPFGNMRLGLYSQRALHHDAAVMSAQQVLRLHTLGSAEVLGVADRVGSLEVGKFADFLVVDHTAPDTGPVWDVYATYVMACGLRNLKDVYIGGRLAAREGTCTAPRAADAPGQLRERITRAAAAAGTPLPDLAAARATPSEEPAALG